MEKKLWHLVEAVRHQSPLVQNITNFVVMNNTANALLAVGASPIMAHAPAELDDMMQITQSLVINIGTLDGHWVPSMMQAATLAGQANKPWVLDPVGAGASRYRDETVGQLLALRPTVIRGNASEILALASVSRPTTKGVDSTAASEEALAAAKIVSAMYGSVVCISGAADIVVGSGQQARIHNGHPLMTRVTGLGCSASAVISAFLAVTDEPFDAVCAAMAMFGICGELAAERSDGPGSLQVSLLDKLYTLSQTEFANRIRMSHDA